jgi:Domain of unknown function (DUF1911)/Domain of unknown function (DUF1910)
MEFHEKRRQQFMDERNYKATLAMWDEVLEGQRANLLKPEGGERGWHCSLKQGIADGLLIKLFLHYTAGEPIEPLRQELEQVVVAFESYGDFLWKDTGDRNEPVFTFTSIDEYCQLMQLIGLCFLLHRRDLLPRLAALQDGLDAEGQIGKGNGGTDTLYEEFMAYALGAETRYETDWLCCSKPYQALFDAITEKTPVAGLKELDLFLKRWYKDLAGCGWYDSHKEDGGYYGYWSFEAAAAVLLLGIEDDSSLHKYLYYPKHLLAWAREHMALAGDTQDKKAALRLRALAGQPCPRSGYYFTPAKSNSRRHFQQGDMMPSLGGDYGVTIWQWDEQQA